MEYKRNQTVTVKSNHHHNGEPRTCKVKLVVSDGRLVVFDINKPETFFCDQNEVVDIAIHNSPGVVCDHEG
tara:strand:- start:8602 stop:8814 length:213 start_codon:yes stop_codon:yes gene_type:complete